MLHIPYRGSAQAINDLVGGEVQVMFDNTPSIGPHVKAGKVRALGVSSAKRAGEFPDVPPIGDTVKGYETTAWGGIIGPANLPKEVVARLVAEARRALASPNVREALRKLEAEPDGSTPEEFVALVRRETPKWADVIRRSGAKVD
jgi:tripartite-type tricarboxylate transporter receptor subunit TctC